MKGYQVKILDHGSIELVDHMGNDMSVVRAARVSYNAEPRNDGSDEKLINYLMKNRHTSPFEAVQFTFDIRAPIFVFRQWHRHRTWSYNEISARYSKLPEEFYVPSPHTVGFQSKDNKQMRDTSQVDLDHGRQVSDAIWMACKSSFNAYQHLIDMGCPRELARSVLPVATYSHMFASVDLHNLFHFLKLRLHPHAQFEIRVYAEAMLELITPIVPVCVQAFKTHQLETP